MNQRLEKLKNFFIEFFSSINSGWLYALVIPFFIIFIVSFSYWIFTINNRINLIFDKSIVVKQATEVDDKYFSQLDGKEVGKLEEVIPDIVVVAIDNHPDARPQLGLGEANIVYEFPVEGNLTRFLAIYNKNQEPLAQVGPVRSARPYFFDIISEYGKSLYMHSGGSPQALKDLKNNDYNFYNGDEFSYENYYWRDSQFYGPHNLFTNDKKWLDLYKYFDDDKKNEWFGWKFGKMNATSTESVKMVRTIFFKQYQVEWNYNTELKEYYRTINGELFGDEDNELKAQNVIIQFVNSSVIDDAGRLKVDMIGKGQTRVLRDGKMIRGTWQKDKKIDRTRFYLDNGEEILLNPGKTWILVVPNWIKVEIGN